jgi:redox-sensitive bicupin YhaK (pirin superfamily)
MRALPRHHRTIGAWCLLDHGAPGPGGHAMAIGSHPHIGLHTVTWLLDGEVEHRDSLGTVQVITPGELNLMTAGHGVAHAEDGRASARPPHVVQLWVAQPDASRGDAPRFEHHANLPTVAVGAARATVIVGMVAGVASPATTDAPTTGADLVLTGPAAIPLDAAFEHAVFVLDGDITVDGTPVTTDELAVLPAGRATVNLAATEPARVLLLGGAPLDRELFMWWNFVARERAEIDDAYREWQAHAARFPELQSPLPRIDAPRPQWLPGAGV